MLKIARFLSLLALLMLCAAPCMAAGGYIHPSFEAKSEYSDNYDQAPDGEESAWTFTLSPAFFIALPGTDRKVVPIVSSNDAPGGQGVSRFQAEDYVGFQSSLFYRADFERVQDHSDDNSTKQKLQGVLQYAFAGGLTFELSDVYTDDTDDYAVGDNEERDEFKANLVNAIAYYKFADRLRLRGGYSNYTLDYNQEDDAFKERTDDQVSVYLLYRIMPKTDLFVQYDHIDVDYDNNIVADSTEEHLFVGLKFDTNARISGHLKIGAGRIDTDQAVDNEYDDAIGDASLRYAFWDSSSITLNAKQMVQVTDEELYQNILHTEYGVALSHKFNQKFGMTLRGAIKDREFRSDDNLSPREDDVVTAGVRFSYDMQDWLNFGVGYSFTDSDSDVDTEEYEENTFTISMAMRF